MEITTNHEVYVSPEVAKLLEKAGFDWKCRKCYNKGVLFDMEPDEIRAQCPQHSSYDVSAPTLEVAQRWLREVKNIQIIASPSHCSKNWTPLITKDFWLLHEDVSGIALTSETFDTYEEALESGIEKALKRILNKN